MQIQGDRNIFGMKNNIDIKARAMSFLKFVIIFVLKGIPGIK